MSEVQADSVAAVRPNHLAAIAVGGVAGAIVRWATLEALPQGRLDWGVLVVNTVGSFFLGVIAAMMLHPERRHHPVGAAAGAGFCGSLTTFSTVAVSVATELRSGTASVGFLRLAVSLAAGIGAAWAGWHLTEGAVHRTELVPDEAL